MTTAREDFETAWMTRTGLTKPPARFPNGGDYVYPAANTAWWAWQAACAQFEQDALDAARYRWLRAIGESQEEVERRAAMFNFYYGEELDAPIDAALAAQGEKK